MVPFHGAVRVHDGPAHGSRLMMDVMDNVFHVAVTVRPAGMVR